MFKLLPIIIKINLRINKMDMKLFLEEKITCGKIKSKAKTLLSGQIIYKKNIIPTDLNSNPNIIIGDNISKINTVKFTCIKISYDNSNIANIQIIKSLLGDSTIIISTSPNPKSTDSHLLVFPGFMIKINDSYPNELNLDIFLDNFFPNSIPINNANLYFMIWFNKLLPQNIIVKSSINLSFGELILNDSNTKIFHPNINEYLPIQQTQTLNIKKKHTDNNSCEIVKDCSYLSNMCRGFWIRMHLLDYNNLKTFRITLNEHDRLILSIEQMELLEITKIIENNFVLIFINLNFDSIEWNLPKDINSIREIYSNSLNVGRIDTVKFIFAFKKKCINSHIQITSLSLNFLDTYLNLKKYNLFT
jgi:hypothetical protein